jgi:hypothetical protein
MLTVRVIVHAAADIFGVPEKALVGDRRLAAITHARQAIMAVAHAQQRWGCTHIARVVNKDHTTVLHALRAVAERRRRQPDYDAKVRALEARVAELSGAADRAEWPEAGTYLAAVQTADHLAEALTRLARKNPVYFADLVRPVLAAALKPGDAR